MSSQSELLTVWTTTGRADTQQNDSNTVYVGRVNALRRQPRTSAKMSGGVFVNFSMSRSLGIQPEILFVQKGFANNINYGVKGNPTHLDYVEVPLLMTYSVKTGGSWRPWLMAGPYADFLFNPPEPIYPPTYPPLSAGTNVSITHHAEAGGTGALMGVAFGGGIGLAAGKGELFISARYDAGLFKMWDYTGIGLPLHDRSVLIFAGYSLKIK